jgi:hypothetical protein
MCPLLSDFYQIRMCRQVLVKLTNVKFYEYAFSRSRAVYAYRRTDEQGDFNTRSSAIRSRLKREDRFEPNSETPIWVCMKISTGTPNGSILAQTLLTRCANYLYSRT